MKSLAQFTFVTDSGHEVAAHRWKNPDGSVGGWVAETATIGKDSIVEIDAIVFPDAIVKPGDIIKSGQQVL